jgi:hypothetical protein
VVFYTKPRGCHLLDPFQALLEIENLAACPAQKMMVVALVRALIPGRLAGDFDRYDLTVFRERLQ